MPSNAHIRDFKRSTWKPLVTAGDGPLDASKFSGMAWLNNGEEWPKCPNCNNHLQLFLQLNLDDLPPPLAGKFGEGLIQLFYCTNQDPLCEVDCEAFFPFARSVVVRLIQKEGNPATVAVPSIEDCFPAKVITGWNEDHDYPGRQEGALLGIEVEESDWEQFSEDDFPRIGDKLSGWPNWIQDVEYPSCPDCGNIMRLVFQIDSRDNLPFDFGDVGCGHITQCETHKERLAFGWACS